MDQSEIVLYLHIPKAAGTALSLWIYDQVSDDQCGDAEDGWLSNGVFYYPSGYVRGPTPQDRNRIDRVIGRSDIRAVVGHFHYGLHTRVTRPYKYITVLRDPLDRILSLFYFQRLVEREDGDHQGVVLDPASTLADFVRNPPYPEIDNGQVRRLGLFVRAVPDDAREITELTNGSP